MVKVVEKPIDQRVGRIEEWGSKGFNDLWTGSLHWGYLKSLNAIVGIKVYFHFS